MDISQPHKTGDETQRRENSEGRTAPGCSGWDHSTDPRFYEYYAKESLSPQALQRFCSIRDIILQMLRNGGGPPGAFDVADIGCGAGTQSTLWAERGQRVHALDVNEPLIELARERAARAGYQIDFRVGSAAQLPWDDESMDVCLANELLEHVSDWQSCLKEFARILRPGGVLFLATSNKLCPIQDEFNLPLYSWYPTPVKRYFERLAVTTRPQLANYAKYPAVNWFSFYSLRSSLEKLGFECMDRFDLIRTSEKGTLARFVVQAIRKVPALRLLGHMATNGTVLLAVKRIRIPEREPRRP